MIDIFERFNPDVIVSVHPLCQHVPLRVLKAEGKLGHVKFFTVVTDLADAHPTWYCACLGHCMLLLGTLHAAAWDIARCCLGHCMLLLGTLHAAAWDIARCCLGHCMLL
eukprot:Polyplicarium_translucidae@DN3988_c0_g1_i1.p2